MKSSRSEDFIRNMTDGAEPDPSPAPKPSPPIASQTQITRRRGPAGQLSSSSISRAGLKHIGAYLDTETVEKVAILRARLRIDNSELFKRAIDEFFAKHQAKRAFGDS